MGFNPDYWDAEPSEADEIFAELRERVYESVSDEITKKIKSLTAENRGLSEIVKNLKTLEHEAEKAKREYEFKLENLQHTTKSEMRRMEAERILSFLAEEKFSIVREWEDKPKCDKCDENRYIPYTTPLGRNASERCDCSQSTPKWVPAPMMVKSINGTGGDIRVWFQPISKKDRWDRDEWDMRSRILKTNGTDEEMAESPSEYGFDTLEEAQRICDLANIEKETSEEQQSWL